MNAADLRPYQLDAVNALRQGFADGKRAQILVAPTGSGKTEIGAHLIALAQAKGTFSAFVVDRVVLVNQTSARFDRYGIEHGCVQSGHWRYRPNEIVQICSAQTLEKRGFFPGCKFLIVDEAHTMRKQTTELIKNRTDIKVIGLTATPFTKGLSEVYDNVVNATTTKQLQADGFLSPVKVYAAKAADMAGAKVIAGEWSDKEVETRGLKIIGDIFQEWVDKTALHFGGPVKTIVFSATVDHGSEICKQFQAAGFNFQQISYKDSNDDRRKELIDEFSRPDSSIMGLVSCEVLAKGFDVPDVLCGIAARPYRKSLSSHIQQFGRVMRIAPGKEFALWLCMARGSRVLTDKGLVPIEQVSLSHRIWDGTNFVSHGGSVCNGIQKVITYRGLTATPGHLVHTAQGWRTFGDCARKQIAITQTGIGGQAIRIGDDHFPGLAVAGPTASTLDSCAVRVREVRLSIRNFIEQLRGRSHGWLSNLQSTGPGLPDVALCTGSGDAGTLPKPKGRELPTLWCLGRGVQIRGRKGGNALDHGEHRHSGQPGRYATGSGGPDRALRVGQYPLADGGSQPIEQTRQSGGCTHAQVEAGASGNSLFGQHTQAPVLVRNDGCGNHREVSQTIGEAEREVWDILDCGPENRFTCEGLLVHNCHSGNYLRFIDDTEDVFANGVSSLDNGERDAKARKEPDEKEVKQLKCRGCGFVLPRNADHCPACGMERLRRSMVENIAGQMVLINGRETPAVGKYAYLANKDEVWRQLAFVALKRKGNDLGAAQRYAQAKYNSFYGQFARRKIETTTPMAPSYELTQRIRSDNIRFAKRRQAA